MLDIVIAFIKGMRNTLIPVAAAIGGLILGLIIGWVVWPVEWTDAGPEQLRVADYQQIYLRNLAAVYKANPNPEYARAALSGWSSEEAALESVCNAAQMASEAGDPVSAQDLQVLATVLDSNGCSAVTAAAAEEGGGLLTVCLWGLVLLAVIGILVLLLQRRMGGAGGGTDFEIPTRRPSSVPEAPPATEVEGGGVAEGITPIASYRTTYTLGLDAYDDSFSIESASGDFLGECGVGISESIGTESPRKITAMEVWLFDKNDIRTITKVAMSDHAFFDEAIKAKLAPKGEPVLARPDEVIVLETESLIINAKITSMDYGDDPNLPEKSYFEEFGIELSAWAKDGALSGESDMDFDDMF